MEAFKDLLELRDAYKKKIEEYGVDKFKELFTDYFKRYPMVQQVYWEQYAPHFNDGDPCVFGVHDGHILVTKEFVEQNEKLFAGYQSEDEDEENGEMDSVGGYPEGPRWFDTYFWKDGEEAENEKSSQGDLYEARRALSKLLEVEDVLESVFGHAGILVTRTEDGIELEFDEVSHE